jgi:nucleolar protein 15
MRGYFSQFGTVIRLRLSRNKKTGQSKHYAFIEFSDEEVAQIVADTMNNYLLFGHILKCKVVPRDNIEYVESLFKGANRRFNPRPAAKLAKAKMENKKPEEVWEKKLDRENRKRKSVNAKLSAKGIDYEFEAPVARKAVEESAVTPATEETPPEEPVQMSAEEKLVDKAAAKKSAKKSAKKTTARVKKTKKGKKVKA